MKYINYKFFVILTLLVIIASCKKDKYQDYSKLVFNNEAYVAPFSVLRKECEGSLDIPFKFVNGPQIVDQHFEVSIVGGTATEGVDYDLVTHNFSFTAFKDDSTAISLDIYADEDVEADETIILRVKEIGAGSNFPTDSVDITVTILSTELPILDIEFAWDKDIIFGTDTFSTCDETDIDVYLFDENGSMIEIFGSVTANCPEAFSLDMSGDAFTFYFASNLWANYLRADHPDDDTPYPITTTISSRITGNIASFTQSDVNAYKVSSLDGENDGDETFQDIAKVEFDGQCTFLIYNTDTDASTTLRKSKPLRK